MIECKINAGQIRNINLYYKNDADTVHYVADNKDKLYIKHRTSVPKMVMFFDTIREMDRFVQKEILEDRA